MDSPKVSVAIVTYNQEKYVAQAIESVLMQEVDFDLEIVVSDDCSTDDTPNILRFFQSQYPDKIRLLLNETNLGMHKNFEQAFFSCQGKYVALLEGDDYWTSSQKLQQQVDFLEGHPDHSLCFHNALIIFEDDRPDFEFCPADLSGTPTIEQLFQSNFIPTASVLYRRELVPAFPDWIFQLKMLDWPLHLLHAHSGKMKYLDQVMSVYRIHAGGAWASRSPVWQNREILRMLETINQHFDSKYALAIDKSINCFYEKLLISYEQAHSELHPELNPLAHATPDESPMQEQSDLHQPLEATALAVQSNDQLAVVSDEGFLDRSSFVLKGTPEQPLNFPPGDYVSPGFQTIKPDRCFPEMLLGHPEECPWPFLRREIPHNWYVDARYPTVGFINRDEAHILYNSALMFRGKRALEVGCWMGWSACHLALAGLELDVIDPVLEKPEFFESVRDSLKRAGVLSSVRLIPGFSPEKVAEIARQENLRWSFMFIDGNHESPGPLNDVRMCERFAEEDALVLFHDLSSPCVAEALDYMQRKGWSVMIYHTMQIMAVAWRGDVKPVAHEPDPSVCWLTPTHLQQYAGNPGKPPFETSDTLHSTLTAMQSELDWLRTRLKSSEDSLWQVQGEKRWFETELQKSADSVFQNQNAFAQSQAALTQSQADLKVYLTQLEQSNLEKASLQAELQQAREEVDSLQQRNLELQQQRESVETYLNTSEQAVQTLQTELQRSQERNQHLEAELQKKRERLQLRKKNLENKKSELAEVHAQIAAMESSKFWKLREKWFKFKRILRSRAD